jgi:hypothetical protein
MSIPRPTLTGTIALLATLSIALVSSNTPAQAIVVHHYLNQIHTEGEPFGIVVGSNGEAYVRETLVSGTVVTEYGSAGEIIRRLSGSENPEEFSWSGPFPKQVNVGELEVPASNPEPGPLGDPFGFAVNPTTGDIYILNQPNGFAESALKETIDEFDSSGAFLIQMTGENIPTGAAVEGRFQYSTGLAVDSDGNIYINDKRGAVDEFNATGGFVTQLTGADVPSSAPVANTLGEPFQGGLAVAPNGDLYAVDYKRDAVDIFEYGRELANTTIGSPIGLSSNTVTFSGEVNPEGRGVTGCSFEYGTGVSYGSSVPCSTGSGNPVGAGGSPVAVSAPVVGLSPGTTYHYRLAATNDEGTNVTGDETLLTPPGVEGAAQASNITSFAARLSGLLGTGEITAGYHFVYGLTSSYGSVLPQPDAIADAGGIQSVSQVLTGLEPDTTYHFALVATNFGGGVSVGPDETFTTRPLVPPSVGTGGSQAVGETSGTLTGTVNPEGLPTTYRFEYGSSTAYGSTWPLIQVFAGAGSTAQGVAVVLANLQPGVGYHYRLVASNEDGTTYGADQTFTTTGYPVSVIQQAPILTANLGFLPPQGPVFAGEPKAKHKQSSRKGKTKKRSKKGRGRKSSVDQRMHRKNEK